MSTLTLISLCLALVASLFTRPMLRPLWQPLSARLPLSSAPSTIIIDLGRLYPAGADVPIAQLILFALPIVAVLPTLRGFAHIERLQHVGLWLHQGFSNMVLAGLLLALAYMSSVIVPAPSSRADCAHPTSSSDNPLPPAPISLDAQEIIIATGAQHIPLNDDTSVHANKVATLCTASPRDVCHDNQGEDYEDINDASSDSGSQRDEAITPQTSFEDLAASFKGMGSWDEEDDEDACFGHNVMPPFIAPSLQQDRRAFSKTYRAKLRQSRHSPWDHAEDARIRMKMFVVRTMPSIEEEVGRI